MPDRVVIFKKVIEKFSVATYPIQWIYEQAIYTEG